MALETLASTATGVPFPGPSGQVLLPLHRRVARSGIAAYAACRPAAVLAQWGALAVVTLFGARGAGRPAPVGLALEEGEWEDLLGQLRTVLPGARTAVVHRRRQGERSGFGLLLHDDDGARLAFVRVGLEAPGVEQEVLAHAGGRYAVLTVPRLLGTGTAGEWSWLAIEPLPARVTTMGDVGRTPWVLPAVVDDLRRILAAVPGPSLPRPEGTPENWEPMHGDLTPWNLRSVRGRLFLFDWQDAGYGPPGADAVMYLACRAVVDRRMPPVVDGGERTAQARAFWSERIAARARGAATDERLNAALLAALAPRA